MQRNALEKYRRERIVTTSIVLTCCTAGLFAPVGIPLIVLNKLKIAQLNMSEKIDNEAKTDDMRARIDMSP